MKYAISINEQDQVEHSEMDEEEIDDMVAEMSDDELAAWLSPSSD